MPTRRNRMHPAVTASAALSRITPSAVLASDSIPLYRDDADPFRRHLLPDGEAPPPELAPSRERLARLRDLPRPTMSPDGLRAVLAQWNSVALFFNLDLPSSALPAGYRSTSAADASNWLDEGADPLSPGISEFMCRYWATLSYGHLAFGMNTPRSDAGVPLVPSLAPPGGDAQNWEGLIRAGLDINAERIWRAAGSLMRDGKRWIPSVVLVQNYDAHASAYFTGFDHVSGGQTYQIGDLTHIRYSLARWSPPDAPQKVGRNFWGTLCHEYGHNFIEFVDLYGPQGCTGYWDLLGDNSPPGRMSEVCSAFKARIDWLSFRRVIEGPHVATTELSLAPYTTTGEAYKVVPDPVHNPWEYFLLEYRVSTGAEVWRPDGAIPDGGLLIIHMNERLGGVADTWLLRSAPFFDPEFADASDRGTTKWTGHDDIAHKTFPYGVRNAFTPGTTPSSNFYGGRPSGLFITNIRVAGGRVGFSLRIEGSPRVGWTVSVADRGLAGRFTPESATGGEEVLIRNQNAAALLVHRDAQWFAVRREDDWIGGWNLGADNGERVADLDGDGRDEVYIRSPDWAGVLKWQVGRFVSVTVQEGWIDNWNLTADNWEIVGDLDGDGADEIVIRSPEWIGLLKLTGGRLRLQSIQQDWVDGWNLGHDNSEHVGRFSRRDLDEIVIRSPEWLGLMRWDVTARRFRLVRLEQDWIDSWNLGPQDQMTVGDLDGDGLDEIYIRSPNWAGVLKWGFGRFRVLWMVRDGIDHVSGQASDRQPLRTDDRSYAGRFRMDRDGILHRRTDGIAVLAWSGTAMQAVHSTGSRVGPWALGAGDNYVLGDFHRSGPDVVEAPADHVIDGLTDIFLHNAWGTGMIGVNHGFWRPGDLLDQLGLTWIQPRELLVDH